MRKLFPIRRVQAGIDDLSDEALLAACASGDSVALGALFDRHCEVVRGFLARLLERSSPHLDDLVQLTFETVHRRARKFQGRSSVRTWILGIAYNMSRRHMRTEVRKERVSLALCTEPPLASPSIHDEVARREMIRTLNAQIDALPTKLRAVFVLVYLEGLSGSEAARCLNIPQGTVWKRLHVARGVIKDAMKGWR